MGGGSEVNAEKCMSWVFKQACLKTVLGVSARPMSDLFSFHTASLYICTYLIATAPQLPPRRLHLAVASQIDFAALTPPFEIVTTFPTVEAIHNAVQDWCIWYKFETRTPRNDKGWVKYVCHCACYGCP